MREKVRLSLVSPDVRILRTTPEMPDDYRQYLEVLWEHVEDHRGADLFGRIVALVLDDQNELSTAADIDRRTPIGLNEGVPVENTKNQKYQP